ncbi:glycosyltransferase family 2 protein [Maricaulis sp.]|uniref:glycosyltransferase family 2 protein n=1 Tax=Maricaulis sp. TaxID=1486257 RepID=UPI002B27B1DC|nr:glycosyltransferase family 2 protein [Maricaulis sp.]
MIDQSGPTPLETVASVSVLIVAYRSRKTVGRCLDALQAQTRRPLEIRLLENGSPAGERIGHADLPASVDFVESSENLGFATGNNRLASGARGEWLALLNPDAFAHPDWIEQFEQACQRHPGVPIFGSTQLAADTPGVLDGTGDCYHAAGLAYRSGYGRPVETLLAEGEVFAACGAAMFIRRDLFEALGGFDDRFFCYNEDVDLAYRARLLGHRIVQLRDARVDHVGYGSSGRRSAFATYHGVRNRLWVFMKNTPGWLFWVLLPGHILATLALWLSSLRFGQAGVFFRAIRDALSGRADIMATRRQVQAGRRVPVVEIARMMNWSPVDLVTRRPKVRLPGQGRD